MVGLDVGDGSNGRRIQIYGYGFERINESKPKSKSDKYIESIIQPDLRVILNPTPNPNPLDNTDLKSNPTRDQFPIRTRIQIR